VGQHIVALCSKCFPLALTDALRQTRSWSVAWSATLCWIFNQTHHSPDSRSRPVARGLYFCTLLVIEALLGMILSNFITWFSPDKSKMMLLSGFQRVYCFWSSQTVNWLQLILFLWPEGIRLITASRQRIITFRRVHEASVNYCYKYSLLHQRRPNCHVTSFVRWLRLSWCNYYGEHTQTHTVYCRQTVDILYKRIQNVKCHNQFI